MKAGELVRGWPMREWLPRFLPNNASAVSLATTGVAWAWSAYSQITAGEAMALVPVVLHCTVKLNMISSSTTAAHYELQLATGAAGAEVPFATFTDALTGAMGSPGASTTAILTIGRTFPVSPITIAASTPISARVRTSIASATLGNVNVAAYLGCFPGGDIPPGYRAYDHNPYLAGIPGAQANVAPAGGTLSLTPGAAWAWGAWVQAIASAAKDLLVRGMLVSESTSVSGPQGYIQVGTGAAASEMPRGMTAHAIQTLGVVGLQQYLRPLFIQAGERVALRASMNSTTAVTVTMLYEELQ